AVILTVWTLFVSVSLAAPPTRHYRVAILVPGVPFNSALEELHEGFREELSQLGYNEGQNLSFLEDMQGDVDGLTERAVRIVEAKPDLILTIGTTATVAAKQATERLPIVFAFVADPLKTGLIAGYASSQNNVTGISNYAGPLSGKRLEILQEVA